MQLLSRKLSKVLRHQALALGLPIAPSGYVPIPALLDHSMFKQHTIEEIIEVVRTSDKQRFRLEEVEGVLSIRANQGHSMDHVKSEELLEQLSPQDLASLSTIVHGTYNTAWESIQETGLNRMKRNHVHFATSIPAEGKAISGMRKSCQVYIYVDGKKCADDGIVFYRSANGVILTAGEDGVLPSKYFLKVTDSCGNEIEFKPS